MVERKGVLNMRTLPYFMTNEDWYYHDEEEFKYKLTNQAPQKAIDSYNEFYEEDYVKVNGEVYHIQK